MSKIEMEKKEKLQLSCNNGGQLKNTLENFVVITLLEQMSWISQEGKMKVPKYINMVIKESVFTNYGLLSRECLIFW